MNRLRVLLALVAASAAAQAAVLYSDPVNGRMENDGSREHPWASLEKILAENLGGGVSEHPRPARRAGPRIRPGDTVLLLSGNHGKVDLRGAFNQERITVEAAPGHRPVLHRLRLTAAANWTFRGLVLFPESSHPKALIEILNDPKLGDSRDITIEDCELFSAPDVRKWTIEDWNTRAVNGIQADGDRCVIRNNRIRNIGFGISCRGREALVEKNLVENFAGDGIRGLGDYSTYQFNTIRNCYDVNENHDDGFQSWSAGPDGRPGSGIVRGVKLAGNVILDFTDPDQPFRGSLQGIGCFDGMFEDWVIENNIVVSDVWHAIALYGARNCRIVNNTILDHGSGRPRPWILVEAHKNGTPSSGCLVRNNLCGDIRFGKGERLRADHNLNPEPPGQYFIDADSLDLRLKAGSPAVDQGTNAQAPPDDIAGHRRPIGRGVDIGAYEFSPDS